MNLSVKLKQVSFDESQVIYVRFWRGHPLAIYVGFVGSQIMVDQMDIDFDNIVNWATSSGYLDKDSIMGV